MARPFIVSPETTLVETTILIFLNKNWKEFHSQKCLNFSYLFTTLEILPAQSPLILLQTNRSFFGISGWKSFFYWASGGPSFQSVPFKIPAELMDATCSPSLVHVLRQTIYRIPKRVSIGIEIERDFFVFCSRQLLLWVFSFSEEFHQPNLCF